MSLTVTLKVPLNKLIKDLIIANLSWFEQNSVRTNIVIKDAITVMDKSLHNRILKDGTIVLNISTASAKELYFEDDKIILTTSFSGTLYTVHIPYSQIYAVYTPDLPVVSSPLPILPPDVTVAGVEKTEKTSEQEKPRKSFLSVVKNTDS